MRTPTPAPVPRLHVLTDTRPGRDPLTVVDAALEAGARCIQVRAEDVSDRDLFRLACDVVARCRDAGAVAIVNDRLDIALASGADGVHLGADDLPVRAARDVAGDRLLIGGTARDAATARALVADGADYLGVGPVYATTTKHGLPAPFGPAGIAPVTAAVDVPVIAISGITPERVPEVLDAGAHGVAVVGAVSRAGDPGAATRELIARLTDHTDDGTEPA